MTLGTAPVRPTDRGPEPTEKLLGRRRLPVGAEVLPGGGVHFRVWAPKRREVAVVIDGRGGDVPLPSEGNGYFSGLVEDAKAATARLQQVQEEIIDSLLALGVPDRHRLIVAGRALLMRTQELDGGWGGEDDEYGRFHTVWTAIDGLRDHRWRAARTAGGVAR